jgi:hypothetical protein
VSWFDSSWFADESWFNDSWFNEDNIVAEDLRQGSGLTREVVGTPPTTRTDGTPLTLGEIQGYNWYVGFNGTQPVNTGMTQLVAGAFSDSFDVDSQTPGSYTFYYTTMDVNNLESPPSNALVINILAPLALPNPPVIS